MRSLASLFPVGGHDGVTLVPPKAYWAYNFLCDRTLEELCAVFNEKGPWVWRLRESAWYGDYLNTRPTADGGYLNTRPAARLRVRVHKHGAGNFTALLEVEGGSEAARDEVESIIQRLLSGVDAREISEIEPYD